MEDQEITRLFLERSEQALVELISKYGKAVAKITGNILADPQDAEECANDTYDHIFITQMADNLLDQE